jgi:hypothetical protein
MATTGKRTRTDTPNLARISPESLASIPKHDPEPTPDDEKEREQSLPLDMLFREAEVIAQNLKESGTRR